MAALSPALGTGLFSLFAPRFLWTAKTLPAGFPPAIC